MKRSHTFNKTPNFSFREVGKKTAIHEAGHAAAIYLGNKQNGLPPVFFQISIRTAGADSQAGGIPCKLFDNYIAKVEGGRLIQTLPSSFDEATKDFSPSQKLTYQRAFEADIINFLVGPLAEAKYVALSDNEPISPLLVNINALHNYGGMSDLKIVNEYLECFTNCNEQKKIKVNELYQAAFDFISEYTNWRGISALADYLLASDQDIIERDEIIDVLESNSHRMAAGWYGGIRAYQTVEPIQSF